MAGLFDFMESPRDAGMVNLALGLLGASGPSRTPVSLGQALAHGGAQGMQAYQGTKDAKHRELMQQLALQKHQMQAQAAMKKMENDAKLQETIFGGGGQFAGPRAGRR